MHKANAAPVEGRQRTSCNVTSHRELSGAEKKAQTVVDSTTAERHVPYETEELSDGESRK